MSHEAARCSFELHVYLISIVIYIYRPAIVWDIHCYHSGDISEHQLVTAYMLHINLLMFVHSLAEHICKCVVVPEMYVSTGV